MTRPMTKRTVLERITRNNSAICLIDHQVGLLLGVRDITVAELKRNVVGLAKAAKILGMPTIASTTAKDVLWGPTFPELVAVLDTKKYPIIDRMTMNAWDDPHFVKAVELRAGRISCLRALLFKSVRRFLLTRLWPPAISLMS
jgi:nicotinamidase-related amidase